MTIKTVNKLIIAVEALVGFGYAFYLAKHLTECAWTICPGPFVSFSVGVITVLVLAITQFIFQLLNRPK